MPRDGWSPGLQEEDLSMAKRAKKRRAKAKRATYGDAIKALQGVRAPKQEFGRFRPDGTLNLDFKKLEALKRKLGAAAWPHYRDALITACRKAPPPFGTKGYGKIYRDVAKDPDWMANSLIQNAQGEGEGSGHLWDLAASTPESRIAAQVKAHAIDESRHSKAYVAMLELAFPG